MPKKERNIKTSAFTLRFANSGKRQVIADFLKEYTLTANRFIGYFWAHPFDKRMVTKEIYSTVESRLSAKARQVCAAQALGIVRSVKAKQQRRIYRFNKLTEEQKFESAAKLFKKIEETKLSKPYVSGIRPELTSSLVEIVFSDESSFNGWLNLGALHLDGASGPIRIPLRKHKHFNDLANKGKVLKSVLLSKNSVDLRIEIPTTPKRTEGSTIGLDIGFLDVWKTSDGQSPPEDTHGWTLPEIIAKICRKKPGSHACARAQAHRKNYINFCLNNLDLGDVKVLRLEEIKDLRRGRRTSSALRHWTYTDISRKLVDLCIQSGVRPEYTDPAFTSQRCSVCGWVKKTNRNGKSFECTSCGFATDADLNAAINISLDLVLLPDRKELDNRTGFYWKVRQEPIVPDTQKKVNYLGCP